MNRFGKWILALLTIVMLASVLTACGGGKDTEQLDVPQTSGETLFDDTVQLSIVIGSHPSWPYNENWAFWSYLREAVGGTIEVQAIPVTDIATKVTLMMASPDSLPDLLHYNGKDVSDKFAPSGALIAIDDYIDEMPHYTAFWDSLDEQTRNRLLMTRKGADGKTYYPQIHGMDRSTNVRMWMYRKDIFEKHNLTVPTTMEELYRTAKELKALYPESYPLCMRSAIVNFSVMGPQWKPYFSPKVYYDFDQGVWSYGATEDTMLDVVEFFKKMRDEDLVPPDFLTIPSKTWEELISTDRGFMLPEYQTRMDFFNIPMQAENPEFMLDFMPPPIADVTTGQSKVAKFNADPTGYMVCNTGDEERILNAIRFLDWMYSDQAAELLSWGKEGETYEETPEGRSFILGEGESPKVMYGAQTYGLYQRVLPDAADAAMSKEQANTTDGALAHTEENYNPVYWLAFNDEETRVLTDIGAPINSYCDEMLSKFILGQEPLSSWDAFRQELQEMGVDELLSAYRSAYERIRE